MMNLKDIMEHPRYADVVACAGEGGLAQMFNEEFFEAASAVMPSIHRAFTKEETARFFAALAEIAYDLA